MKKFNKFVAEAEGLAGLVRKAIKEGLYGGYEVGKEKMEISFAICG